MRQSSAGAASRSTRDLLDASRQAEIDRLRTASGLTRLQIEERQFNISQEIFRLEEAREVREAEIAVIKETKILPLERERERILKLIRVDEDRIFQINKERLIPAQQALDIKIEALNKLQEELDKVEKEREKELTHLESLKLQWIEVKGNIAAAKLETINLQAEIQKAINLANQLAAAFASIAAGKSAATAAADKAAADKAAADKAAADKAARDKAAADAKAAAEYEAATNQTAKTEAEIAALIKAREGMPISGPNDPRVLYGGQRTSSDGTLTGYNPEMAAAMGGEPFRVDSAGNIEFYDPEKAAALSGRPYTATTPPVVTPEEWSNQYGAIYKASGGMVMPKYFAAGGYSRGTDTVPAMLTPGEFVMSRYAVSNYGVDKMKAINSGSYDGEKVYNYNLSVNVKSDSNPDEIARVVIKQIQQLDNQKIRRQGN
jgi:colicin import membrane protein